LVDARAGDLDGDDELVLLRENGALVVIDGQ
jgi:hypothetical protein